MAFPGFRREADISILKIVVLAAVGMIVLTVATFAFLVWSTWKIDTVSVARQSELARHVISRFRHQIAHDQESATVWDDAVTNVRAYASPESMDWINANLGEWMHTYFGHDAAYVITAEGKPVYVFSDGMRQGAGAYNSIAATAAPMLGELRAALIRGDPIAPDEGISSPGVSDFRLLNGRPAVVSLKPIISDSGEIEQVAGEEFIHIAVRYLDGTFLRELETKYDFGAMHFSRTDEERAQKASLPLTTTGGDVIGYLVWEPYRPGLAFLQSITPALVAILLCLVGAVGVFIGMLYRRAMANREQEARIRYLASHDSLTGLLNRASFETRLDAALSSAAGTPQQIAVLYLDLDRFKPINDTLGHPVGDTVIREVAERICRLAPEGAPVCRVGGDEFNVLVPYAQVEEIEVLCRAIVRSICQPIDIHGQNVFVGISIGVALSPVHGTERTELTRKADVALYSAKASGRGCYSIFGPHMDALVRERAEIERDLRDALSDYSQFEVLYQPKYFAATGAIGSVEALVRWHHPTRGLISPAYFIPIAEEAGLIRELGRFVLKEACRAAAAWPIANVAVNISAVQLRDEGFAMEVMAVLAATGLAPQKLEIEVTETAWMDSFDSCVANIRALRAAGICIALDDFGTGFSTFGRLHETEVDHIKIDKMFVEGLGKNRGDEAIIQAIVELARAKGLKTTAEGVETEEQNAFLTQIGCDELQGFLFAKPMRRADVADLLSKTGWKRKAFVGGLGRSADDGKKEIGG
ncbi:MULTISPECIES: putative bifunctional diguanylate cyclase/phosphodiesterase [Alphaproteobacteria]|uniref:Bifunctional diguanylate cyclase/phosphodiesterase n=2 Tax=Alphaproteobacteria TaxID=28211 RepID=A0A512HEW7_9HYPH|nr:MULTISPECIES: EAL domain-containing protein [Alphaproteobacteria]GEO83988.1 bifunctional diguanylate cyclase/phosphodiesterase [Ciceribacter naphthalenivorans]GLR21134.1 bifunctional diguanylate cyclase/phosphodiesterase [Ciceribacter naphthalenivorans]GLT03990.1 bifunctional diguanylate cyclase/phosphodiesterase [Sphingomonas psychrolutea]